MTERNASIDPAKLEIIQVNSVFNGGGADNQTLELAHGLLELGHRVTVAAAEGNWLIPKARGLGLRVETFDDRRPLKLGMISSLARLLRRQRPAILHAHQGRDYWPAVAAARLANCGTRVVVTRHLVTKPHGFSRHLLLRACDVIAVSKAVARVLDQELSGPHRRLHQIYGGIDPEVFCPSPPEQVAAFRAQQNWPSDTAIFGIVGSFNLPRGKGHLELLRAAAQLRELKANFRIAIVGHGTMDQVLAEEIKRLNLQSTVHMFGFSHEIAHLVQVLDVLVHPAIGSEAFGLVILEALSCGKPVIASDLDGIPETFIPERHGFLVPPGDIGAIRDAMQRLILSPELRQRMGLEGRLFVKERFTRAQYAQNVARLYDSILRRD